MTTNSFYLLNHIVTTKKLSLGKYRGLGEINKLYRKRLHQQVSMFLLELYLECFTMQRSSEANVGGGMKVHSRELVVGCRDASLFL